LSKDAGGLNDAKWFTLPELQDFNTYDDIFPLIARAVTIITQNK
jgi:hypothetical protein